MQRRDKAQPLSAWVHPYALSNESLVARSDLSVIAKNKDPPGFRFAAFPKDKLAEILVVKIPSNEALNENAAFLAKVEASNLNRRMAQTKAKTKKPRLSKRAAEPVVITANDSLVSTAAYSSEMRAMPRLESDHAIHPLKRTRLDEMHMQDPSVVQQMATRTPSNLQEILEELFTVFWEMDVDDACNVAFFSIITPLSCANVGLADYFTKFPKLSKAYTIASMKEKLDKGQYTSVESFAYDFRQMCANAVEYYPAGSAVATKAAEMKATFETDWAAAQNKFKYS